MQQPPRSESRQKYVLKKSSKTLKIKLSSKSSHSAQSCHSQYCQKHSQSYKQVPFESSSEWGQTDHKTAWRIEIHLKVSCQEADGTKEEIDISKAVKVETDVPRSYSSSYQSSDYYKIAIPNLEIGDILDYFKVFTENYTSDINIIAPISSYYPRKYSTWKRHSNWRWSATRSENGQCTWFYHGFTRCKSLKEKQ